MRSVCDDQSDTHMFSEPFPSEISISERLAVQDAHLEAHSDIVYMCFVPVLYTVHASALVDDGRGFH